MRTELRTDPQPARPRASARLPAIEPPPPRSSRAAIPTRGGLDLRGLTQRLLRCSPLLVAALLAGGLLGFVILRVIPARYTSSVSILIDPKRPDSYGAEGAFANLYVDNAKISGVELIMVSSSLLEQVVRAERLADMPEFGDARPSLALRLLPVLGAGQTPQPDTPAARELRAIAALSQSIRTQRVGVTYVIRIDVSAPRPDLARRLAGAVAGAYMNDQLETKHDAARRDVEWLAERLKQLRGELIRSEDVVEAVRKQHGLTQTDSAPGSTVDRQLITDANAQLAQVNGEVAAKQSRYAQVERLQSTGGNLQGLPEVAASPVIVALRQQQASANRSVADMSARYTAAFPGLAAAQADLKTLNAQIAAETSRIIDGIRNDAEAAVTHRDAIRLHLARLIDASSDDAGAAGRVELREAERVAEANRTVYDATLAHLRDVEQQTSRQTAEARIISPASEPDAPSFPKPFLFVGAGSALGLGAALGLTVLLPMFERRIVDAAAVERKSALPVLAKIPYLRRRELSGGGKRLTILEYLACKPTSRFAESLRSWRTQLRSPGCQGGMVVQVTSAVPREGKSVASATLAASAATAGLKTVLVDLDFYQPTISKIFGLDEDAESVEVLFGTARPSPSHRPPTPLRIVGSKSAIRPGPRMVETPEFRRFVEELADAFDLVVLDTPPVLATSDAAIISAVVDTTVMLIAWRSTPQAKVDEAVAALRAAGAPLAGIVLNKVGPRSANYDGYGPSYPGYGDS